MQMLTCPAVSASFKERVRDLVQPNATAVLALCDTYEAALVYDAILLSSALPLQVLVLHALAICAMFLSFNLV